MKPIEISDSEKQKFTGDFYDIVTGNTRSIKLEDGRLLYRPHPDRPGSNLIAISSNELVFEVAPFIKLLFDESYEGMKLTIHNQQPSHFLKYKNYTYNSEELHEFESSFYNDDIEEIYEVKSSEGQLQLFIRGKELVTLTPFTKDKFRDEHFGYITFHRDSSGNIQSFTRTDNTFENLNFFLIKEEG